MTQQIECKNVFPRPRKPWVATFAEMKQSLIFLLFWAFVRRFVQNFSNILHFQHKTFEKFRTKLRTKAQLSRKAWNRLNFQHFLLKPKHYLGFLNRDLPVVCIPMETFLLCTLFNVLVFKTYVRLFIIRIKK